MRASLALSKFPTRMLPIAQCKRVKSRFYRTAGEGPPDRGTPFFALISAFVTETLKHTRWRFSAGFSHRALLAEGESTRPIIVSLSPTAGLGDASLPAIQTPNNP